MPQKDARVNGSIIRPRDKIASAPYLTPDQIWNKKNDKIIAHARA